MSKSNWNNGLIHWTENTTAYISVVFSWQLAEAYQHAAWYKAQGYHVRAGGPAVMLNPHYLTDVAEIGGSPINALPHHNPNATYTSRGCIRSCPFCAVPHIEGDLIELDDWEPKPVVCDNNLLACSRAHFDQVIDSLKPVSNIDIQGLDIRLLTKYHTTRLTELNLSLIHIAWDNTRLESTFLTAYQTLRNARIPKKKIRVYVLFGFKDTPEDALHRFQTIKTLGSWPNPMRYQPLNTPKRNAYVAPHWTEQELRRFARYWSRQQWLAAIPFEEYPYRTPAHVQT